MKLTATLTAEILGVMASPGLYVWKRGAEYLYIGTSVNVLCRIATHNVIGKAEPILRGDVIEIYTCPEEESIALEEEVKMTQKHNPKYSSPIHPLGITGTNEERECFVCKKKFMQKRPWQKFCSTKCHSGQKNIGPIK